MAKQTQQRAAFSRAPWICSSCGRFFMDLLTATRLASTFQRTTNEFLQMQHGSLYPALHRLEEEDGSSPNGRQLQIAIGSSNTTD